MWIFREFTHWLHVCFSIRGATSMFFFQLGERLQFDAESNLTFGSWRQRMESVRKDVEDAFGILKGRFSILKLPIQVRQEAWCTTGMTWASTLLGRTGCLWTSWVLTGNAKKFVASTTPGSTLEAARTTVPWGHFSLVTRNFQNTANLVSLLTLPV